ncbi:MAG TPA: hypothetical protein VGK58_03470 [Lacipirellulaceae bacterium]
MLKRPVFQRLVVVAVAAACYAGCTPEVHRYKRFPDFSHPGWAHEQRNDAVAHDPYPVDDAGPEIVGGRPREYQRPLNEVERARMNVPPPIALQPIPVPGLPAAPPPVVTTPVVTPPFASPAVPAVPGAPIGVQPRSPY